MFETAQIFLFLFNLIKASGKFLLCTFLPVQRLIACYKCPLCALKSVLTQLISITTQRVAVKLSSFVHVSKSQTFFLPLYNALSYCNTANHIPLRQAGLT